MKQLLPLVFLFMMSFTHQVFGQEITMFPGFWGLKYYEDENQISKNKLETLMYKDKEANLKWQKSKNHRTLSFVAFGAQLGFLFWQLDRIEKRESQTLPFVGVLAAGGVSIGFTLSANKLKREAILKYNSNLEIGDINIGPTYNGMGLVCHF